MGVAGEIFQRLGFTLEWRLTVDVPVLRAGTVEESLEV